MLKLLAVQCIAALALAVVLALLRRRRLSTFPAALVFAIILLLAVLWLTPVNLSLTSRSVAVANNQTQQPSQP